MPTPKDPPGHYHPSEELAQQSQETFEKTGTQAKEEYQEVTKEEADIVELMGLHALDNKKEALKDLIEKCSEAEKPRILGFAIAAIASCENIEAFELLMENCPKDIKQLSINNAMRCLHDQNETEGIKWFIDNCRFKPQDAALVDSIPVDSQKKIGDMLAMNEPLNEQKRKSQESDDRAKLIDKLKKNSPNSSLGL